MAAKYSEHTLHPVSEFKTSQKKSRRYVDIRFEYFIFKYFYWWPLLPIWTSCSVNLLQKRCIRSRWGEWDTNHLWLWFDIVSRSAWHWRWWQSQTFLLEHEMLVFSTPLTPAFNNNVNCHCYQAWLPLCTSESGLCYWERQACACLFNRSGMGCALHTQEHLLRHQWPDHQFTQNFVLCFRRSSRMKQHNCDLCFSFLHDSRVWISSL